MSIRECYCLFLKRRSFSRSLSQAVSDVASGARTSPLGETERFDLIVGISGHAVYHAGQIQLIRKLI